MYGRNRQSLGSRVAEGLLTGGAIAGAYKAASKGAQMASGIRKVGFGLAGRASKRFGGGIGMRALGATQRIAKVAERL